MNHSSASLPAEESELAESGLTLVDSKEVAVPAIQEAPIRFEVRLHQYVPVSDHEGTVISDLFILEVLNYSFEEAVFDAEKSISIRSPLIQQHVWLALLTATSLIRLI